MNIPSVVLYSFQAMPLHLPYDVSLIFKAPLQSYLSVRVLLGYQGSALVLTVAGIEATAAVISELLWH